MIRTLTDGLLAVVLAPTCAACRLPLALPTAGAVCDGCWGSVRRVTPPYCSICGDPLMSWRSAQRDGRCPECCAVRSVIARGRAVGEYDGSLRAILHALKYDGRRSIAQGLSRMMRAHGRAVLAGADYAVPVPLHWRRHWRRGFNQAAELATGLGLPVLNALTRVRATRTQTDLPADARYANVRHAFAMRRRIQLRGACVVLVDDVRTTGATLDACARILIDAGACEVRALTAARVATRQSGSHQP